MKGKRSGSLPDGVTMRVKRDRDASAGAAFQIDPQKVIRNDV